MTIWYFWEMRWIFEFWKIFFRCIQRVFFFGKILKVHKKLILEGDFEMLFLLKKKRSKSFILSIYTLIEFTLFEKNVIFFVLILKWYVHMVFLKWCLYMVFLYHFLGTWQQGHIEVYKQHVNMVILFDFLDLMTTVAFRDASFFE